MVQSLNDAVSAYLLAHGLNHGPSLNYTWMEPRSSKIPSLMSIPCTSNGIVFAGESIPVRLFLTPYELTPTYRNINNKFSVKYYLNLVLVDEEDRRYFKQQEITMYRLLESAPSS